jgi:hypothetical protein
LAFKLRLALPQFFSSLSKWPGQTPL